MIYSYGGSGMGLSYAGQNKGKNSILSDSVLKAMPKVAHTKGKYEKSLLLQNLRLVQRMIDEQGWILRNEIIWHKPNCMPSSVKDRFTVDFEKIFFFTKSKKYYFNTQYEPVQECSIARLNRAVSNKHKWIDGPDGQTRHTMNRPRPNRNNYKGGGDIGRKNNCAISTHQFDGGDYLVTPFNPKLGRNKRCVWRISTKPFRGSHFAVFPEELVETPIKAGCPKNGIVLDPFMGSGTTAIVAKRLGRNYIGIELNPKYIEMAEKRISGAFTNNGKKHEKSFMLKKLELKIFNTKTLKENVFDRQIQISGFNQERLASATIVLIGAGGLGGEIGEGLVRKGVGRIKIFDSDVVEPSNLNRQFFFKNNLYKNKAISLAQNLARFGFGKTALYGYPYTLEEATALNIDLNCSGAVVGVDNNPCRVRASTYFLERKIPVIFTAVSEDGNSGYVFVQESKVGTPCFGCLNRLAVEEIQNGIHRYPCPNTPAIKDILKTVAGPVLYAIDTLMMSRKREWNYRVIFLDGSIPSSTAVLEMREGCLICGNEKDESKC